MDVIAGLVAIQAEGAQEEVKHMKVWLLECKAPSQKAFVLGIIALVCLAAAHIFAVMIGCSISNIVKVLAVPKISAYINMACLSLTWIVAIAGAGILTMGIWTNRESRSKCGFTNKHFLSFGGKVSRERKLNRVSSRLRWTPMSRNPVNETSRRRCVQDPRSRSPLTGSWHLHRRATRATALTWGSTAPEIQPNRNERERYHLDDDRRLLLRLDDQVPGGGDETSSDGR
ncbi:hypothetical protein HID58_064060 [Brassica napus]|uniref:Uncharacterized protein n=2 Tax=Brassica TaxID=3705 RepID=A0ABQ7Z988_BRANA|nr:hypothetical protein HID58_064060 [Brassica napus]